MPYAVMTRGSYYQNPALQYGPMIPGQDRNAPIPGWGMNPYWAGPPMVGVGAFGIDPEPRTISTGVALAIGGAVIGLVGFAIWANMKVASKIAEKEGSSGLLKYELGSAAIGAGARAVDRLIEGDRYRRNRRRARRRRRHSDD